MQISGDSGITMNNKVKQKKKKIQNFLLLKVVCQIWAPMKETYSKLWLLSEDKSLLKAELLAKIMADKSGAVTSLMILKQMLFRNLNWHNLCLQLTWFLWWKKKEKKSLDCGAHFSRKARALHLFFFIMLHFSFFLFNRFQKRNIVGEKKLFFCFSSFKCEPNHIAGVEPWG